MDVTDVGDVQRNRQELHRHLGPIDILVNNAGIVAGGPFTDVPLETTQGGTVGESRGAVDCDPRIPGRLNRDVPRPIW